MARKEEIPWLTYHLNIQRMFYIGLDQLQHIDHPRVKREQFISTVNLS